jgi:hypothetical protein
MHAPRWIRGWRIKMINLTNDTLLEFTEIKNGHATGKTFVNTVLGYINAVRDKSPNAREFNRIVEAVEFDKDAEPCEWHDKFYDLPLEEMLELCIRVNGECYASHTTWKVAA